MDHYRRSTESQGLASKTPRRIAGFVCCEAAKGPAVLFRRPGLGVKRCDACGEQLARRPLPNWHVRSRASYYLGRMTSASTCQPNSRARRAHRARGGASATTPGMAHKPGTKGALGMRDASNRVPTTTTLAPTPNAQLAGLTSRAQPRQQGPRLRRQRPRPRRRRRASGPCHPCRTAWARRCSCPAWWPRQGRPWPGTRPACSPV